MEYLINASLSNNLLNQVEDAAVTLKMSANSYLREALREKIGQWIDNEPGKEIHCDQSDGVTTRAMLPDELLGQVERAAADFGLSVDEFLQQALQEKVSRLSQDITYKEEMDRAIEYIFEKNGDLFRRLAEWPTVEIASR